jgi:hypothetical protein
MDIFSELRIMRQQLKKHIEEDSKSDVLPMMARLEAICVSLEDKLLQVDDVLRRIGSLSGGTTTIVREVQSSVVSEKDDGMIVIEDETPQYIPDVFIDNFRGRVKNKSTEVNSDHMNSNVNELLKLGE